MSDGRTNRTAFVIAVPIAIAATIAGIYYSWPHKEEARKSSFATGGSNMAAQPAPSLPFANDHKETPGDDPRFNAAFRQIKIDDDYQGKIESALEKVPRELQFAWLVQEMESQLNVRPDYACVAALKLSIIFNNDNRLFAPCYRALGGWYRSKMHESMQFASTPASIEILLSRKDEAIREAINLLSNSDSALVLAADKVLTTAALNSRSNVYRILAESIVGGMEVPPCGGSILRVGQEWTNFLKVMLQFPTEGQKKLLCWLAETGEMAAEPEKNRDALRPFLASNDKSVVQVAEQAATRGAEKRRETLALSRRINSKD